MRIIVFEILLIISCCYAAVVRRQVNSRTIKNQESYEDDGRLPVNLGRQRYYQGDVNFRSKFRNAILAPKRWPNATIYYQISPVYTQKYRNRIFNAMRTIERNSCIRFMPRIEETDYILIFNSSGGCYSESVGRRGGRQKLSLMLGLKTTCFTNAIIVHELLHAVGLWHEHMRYDRDQYITIHWKNVQEDSRGQFEVVLSNESSHYDLPYDYNSIMHYDAFAFSANGDSITMEPTNPAFLYTIGKAKEPTDIDWKKVRRVYSCDSSASTEAPQTPLVDSGNIQSSPPVEVQLEVQI